jgi:rhodanese-related sulfurtransferase
MVGDPQKINFLIMKQRLITFFLFCLLWTSPIEARNALTPHELEKKIAQGESFTLIDIRTTRDFKKGHISGAINIPFRLIEAKKLPPLGEVVVYGDGLGQVNVADAARMLNTKPGIEAVPLTGGFAAWRAHGNLTTRAAGLDYEQIPQISYQKLIDISDEEIIIVDLRDRRSDSRAAEKGESAEFDILASFVKEAPNIRLVLDPFVELFSMNQKARRAQSSLEVETPLLVLVDSNHGVSAQAMAFKLKANGYERFVILSGGEEIMKRRGRSGLKREGRGRLGESLFPEKPLEN